MVLFENSLMIKMQQEAIVLHKMRHSHLLKSIFGILLLLLSVTCFTGLFAKENRFNTNRADAHAPISIMGDHTHSKGESMFSYRYMYMEMPKLISGTNSLSTSEVFNSDGRYVVSPTYMYMHMHMIGVMYASSDNLTFTTMTSFRYNIMDHNIFSGAVPLIEANEGSETFRARASGLGDFSTGFLYKFFDRKRIRIHGGLELTFPSGSITIKDRIPSPGGSQRSLLPSAMQLGSGTYDFIPSLTYQHQFRFYSYAFQVKGRLPTALNKQGYRNGHMAENIFWNSIRFVDWFAMNLGFSYIFQGRQVGVQNDLLLNPPFAPERRTVTTAFGENYGGDRIDVIIGMNFLVHTARINGLRFATDIRVPVYQRRNGIQIETIIAVTVGLQQIL